MHYQERSECQADDNFLADADNLQNVLSELSFQGSVTYYGGCQSESAAWGPSNVGDALAGGTCYVQVTSASPPPTLLPGLTGDADPLPSPSPSPQPLVPFCGCEEAGQKFCNYDYGPSYGGFCEMCPPGYAPLNVECYSIGLPAAGAADCVRWCSVI